MSPIRTKSKKSLSISTNLEKESWYGSTMSPIERCISPESMYCTGICRENPSEEGRLSADVVRCFRYIIYKQVKLICGFSMYFHRFPCLRRRMDSDHGKIRKDRLWLKWASYFLSFFIQSFISCCRFFFPAKALIKVLSRFRLLSKIIFCVNPNPKKKRKRPKSESKRSFDACQVSFLFSFTFLRKTIAGLISRISI